MQLHIERAYCFKKGHIQSNKLKGNLCTYNAIQNQTQTIQCRHKEFQVNQSLTSIDIKQDIALVFSRFQLVNYNCISFLVDYRGTQRNESNSLTVNDLLEFKAIILYYLDFCQKQKVCIRFIHHFGVLPFH